MHNSKLSTVVGCNIFITNWPTISKCFADHHISTMNSIFTVIFLSSSWYHYFIGHNFKDKMKMNVFYTATRTCPCIRFGWLNLSAGSFPFKIIDLYIRIFLCYTAPLNLSILWPFCLHTVIYGLQVDTFPPHITGLLL